LPSNQRGDITGGGDGVLVPGVAGVHRVAERVVGDELLLPLPVLVVRAAEQDPDAEVDLGQVVGDQLAVDDDAGGDEHLPSPVRHVGVREVAVLGVVERSPAAEQHPPAADLLVPGQRLVEEVEEVVVERDDTLHELDVAHEAGEVVREQLDGGDRADAARVERGGVHMAALHQTEHLPGVAADLQGLTVELALQRVERAHDVGDGAVAVLGRVRCFGALGEFEDSGVGLADHLLAVVDPYQILLEDVVVEHVLRGLAEVDDPFTEVRRLHSVRHVLRVHRTGGVVVAADTADAAGDEVSVARVLSAHEDAVAAKHRRGAVALRNALLLEVDLRVDAEAAHDPGDRVPGHLHQAARVGGLRRRCHRLSCPSSWSSREEVGKVGRGAGSHRFLPAPGAGSAGVHHEAGPHHGGR
jgi:hypothetical protein